MSLKNEPSSPDKKTKAKNAISEGTKKDKAESHKTKKGTWCFCGIQLTIETLFNSLFVLAIVFAICILSDAVIVKHNIWFYCSFGFIVLSAIVYLLIKGQEISDKDYKIAELKQEIRRLEDVTKSQDHIIALLNDELEKAQNNSQQ